MNWNPTATNHCALWVFGVQCLHTTNEHTNKYSPNPHHPKAFDIDVMMNAELKIMIRIQEEEEEGTWLDSSIVETYPNKTDLYLETAIVTPLSTT